MWLLVGGDSEIGAETFRVLRARGAPVAATTRRPDRVAPNRPLLDLARPLDGWTPPPGTRSACVFAAVARLAACEADPSGSAHINVTQTTALIERLVAQGIPVVFTSSDKVFDGTRPQVPADAPVAPNCEYGRQKAQVEAQLRRHMGRGADVAILRLSKVVSPDSGLFTDWIAALRGGKPVRAFRDLMFAPVPTARVVEAVAALLADRARGIFQLSGPRDISYADAAHCLSQRIGADATLIAEASAREAGLPAGALAPYTSLDSRLLRERYGIVVPDAWEVLGGIL
jgi:dTDP-4-dehydrorhamnose reductase